MRQPTPARSPTLNFVTCAPTAVTRPTISWPGTEGYNVFFHSLRAVCRSEWQTPQCRIWSWTSAGPGSRREISNGPTGVVAESAAYALTVFMHAPVTIDGGRGLSGPGAALYGSGSSDGWPLMSRPDFAAFLRTTCRAAVSVTP